MRKKHDKKAGINKSSKEAHISGICGEMTEENRISQKGTTTKQEDVGRMVAFVPPAC